MMGCHGPVRDRCGWERPTLFVRAYLYHAMAVFMKEVIKNVWGIGEGLVTDLGGVFVFLLLQNQLPQ